MNKDAQWRQLLSFLHLAFFFFFFWAAVQGGGEDEWAGRLLL